MNKFSTELVQRAMKVSIHTEFSFNELISGFKNADFCDKLEMIISREGAKFKKFGENSEPDLYVHLCTYLTQEEVLFLLSCTLTEIISQRFQANKMKVKVDNIINISDFVEDAIRVGAFDSIKSKFI